QGGGLGRGGRRRGLRPRGFARGGGEREYLRALESAATDDDNPGGDDGRRAGPEVAGRDRRRHLELPQLLAGQVVADHAARAEEREDALAVGRGRGRRRAAALLEVALDLLRRGLPAPRLLDVGAAVGARGALGALVSRDYE